MQIGNYRNISPWHARWIILVSHVSMTAYQLRSCGCFCGTNSVPQTVQVCERQPKTTEEFRESNCLRLWDCSEHTVSYGELIVSGHSWVGHLGVKPIISEIGHGLYQVPYFWSNDVFYVVAKEMIHKKKRWLSCKWIWLKIMIRKKEKWMEEWAKLNYCI